MLIPCCCCSSCSRSCCRCQSFFCWLLRWCCFHKVSCLTFCVHWLRRRLCHTYFSRISLELSMTSLVGIFSLEGNFLRTSCVIISRQWLLLTFTAEPRRCTFHRLLENLEIDLMINWIQSRQVPFDRLVTSKWSNLIYFIWRTSHINNTFVGRTLPIIRLIDIVLWIIVIL